MSILSRIILGPGMPLNAGEVFAGYGSVSIGSASRRANSGARRVGIVGMAVLAAIALGAHPDADAGPAPGCPQGRAPGPGPRCGQRAFPADIRANQDDQFLTLLGQEGIPPISGVPALIDTAHQICGLLAGGTSPNAVVQALVDNANAVTPGADPGRLARSETLFLKAAVGAYCPGSPVGWNGRHRVLLASFPKEVQEPAPAPLPRVPDANKLISPRVMAPAPPPKKAPPVVGPPPGGGGGGGGNGGGTGGATTKPPLEPGIITLAP